MNHGSCNSTSFLFIVLATIVSCITFQPMTGWYITTQQLHAQTQHDQENFEHWLHTLEKSPLVLVRKNAARQLGRMGNSRAIPQLMQAVADPQDEVAREAAEALGRLGQVSIIPQLEQLERNHPSRQVQSSLRAAIERLNTRAQAIEKAQNKIKATTP